ncbi:toll/interleukin-1 receptor domain-containing protein, partial [Parabacteroides merdae]
DKDKSKLKKGKVEEIVQLVESVRARNLASRQDNLITEFMNIAKQCGRNITVQPERYLTEVISDKQIIYIPTIGVPQSFNCQAAEIQYRYNENPQHTCIRLIYDDLRIRDKWLKHLDWLNGNFKKDILTLKKQDFKKWLETTI